MHRRGWLQSNVDRLSQTFGRRVIGIHNPSDGILFDLIQCLIQRNLSYSTSDVREAYLSIKEAILDTRIKKIVFILHSQGGIEGGMIMDWLFAEIPRHQLRRLEIYTFGCAANHFNNPDYRRAPRKGLQAENEDKDDDGAVGKVIEHVEHYANLGDFVSQIGVLNYTRIANRYMGRLFLSPNSGHLLNQHYLHSMFAFDSARKCANTNAFMEMEVRLSHHDVDEDHEELVHELNDNTGGKLFGKKIRDNIVEQQQQQQKKNSQEVAFVGDVNKAVRPLVLFEQGEQPRRLKVKDFSRLWLYRNGGSPDDN
jgi:hypothetical protein